MPKLDLDRIEAISTTTYPEPHGSAMGERWFQALGDAAGLTRFGVSRVRLTPGSTSSLRHWHPDEDEFAVVVAGELTLVDDAGEQVLRPGDCIGWPAGDRNGHHLLNRSDADGVFIVVGSRPEGDCFYSDVDLVFRNDAAGGRYETREGRPAPLPAEAERGRDWKLKLRYGRLETAFQPFTVIVEVVAETPSEQNPDVLGPAFMGFSCWAEDTDQAADMARFFARTFGCSLPEHSKIEIFETDPKEPPRARPHGYAFNWTPIPEDSE